MLLHSQHRFRRHNSHRSLLPLNVQRLPAVVFGFWTCNRCRWGVLHRIDYYTCHLRCVYCSDYISRGITKIILCRSTCRWKSHSHRRPHAPSRATQSFYVSAPRATCVVLNSNWRHPWHHQCHVSPSYVSIQSSADVSATSSCWCHSRWLGPLTLLQGWLLQSRFSLPSFHVDFIFAVCFCILCL